MLSIITNKKIWVLYSYIIKLILKLYGIDVGKRFYIEGTPQIKIKGKASNISLGNNISIFGSIDLRNRENGKIIIEDNVKLDNNVRLVAARDGMIKIGKDSSIGPHTIINGGGNVIIGKKVIFSKNISINANEHNFKKSNNISDQGFVYKDIVIKDDVFLGANVSINKGVVLGEGSVIGANAVVTKDTEPYSINVGIPSKKISERL
jgi:acetyltransferase-like isoleucine patch superfamily enzyme